MQSTIRIIAGFFGGVVLGIFLMQYYAQYEGDALGCIILLALCYGIMRNILVCLKPAGARTGAAQSPAVRRRLRTVVKRSGKNS